MLGKYKLRISIFICISILVFLCFFDTNSAFSTPFSREVDKNIEEYGGNLFYIVPLIAVLLSLLYVAYRKKYLKSIYLVISKPFSEIEQVEKLVDSFKRLVIAIEDRDQNLKKNFEDEKKSNEAKTDFLLNVSHELRTPMHAILNFAEIGQSKVDTAGADKIKLYFSRIEESGERLLNLINSILDLTVLEAGKVALSFHNGYLRDCIDNAVNELAPLMEKKNLKLNISAPRERRPCSIDHEHITRVVINLLSNAIKFSPKGGNIDIDIKFSKEKKGNELINFSISDEGIGIPEDELEVIFKKFIQSSKTVADSKGTGLGLAICKEIIDLHGGQIWAENNKDKGAKFQFFIPI